MFIPFLEKMYLKKSSPFLYWFFNISINVFLSIKYAPPPPHPFHCMWTKPTNHADLKKTWINTTFHISTFLAKLVLRIIFFVYIFYLINYTTSEATSPQRPSDIYSSPGVARGPLCPKSYCFIHAYSFIQSYINQFDMDLPVNACM